MKFTIKQGNHYTNRRWWIWLNKWLRRSRLGYSVVLSKDWWYPTTVIQYSGWNKIFGLGAINHHNTSGRLVCKPDPSVVGKLIVAGYVYERGEWQAYEFSSAYVENARSMLVEATDSGYYFVCGKDQIFVSVENPRHEKKLWPYFGGRDRAYKTVHTTLKRIKDISIGA